MGRPIYKPEKDPELPPLIKKRDEMIEEHKAKIESIKLENKQRRA